MAPKKRKPKAAAKPRKSRPKLRTGPKVWQPAFLAALRRHGNRTLAAEQASIDRSTIYQAIDGDAAFAQAVAQAIEEAADRLEAEAFRRAHDGLLRKKFAKGGEPIIDPENGQQYFEREFSDVLLIFLLKAARPEKYRERHQVTHDGKVNNVVFYLPDNGRDPSAGGTAGTDPSQRG